MEGNPSSVETNSVSQREAPGSAGVPPAGWRAKAPPTTFARVPVPRQHTPAHGSERRFPRSQQAGRLRSRGRALLLACVTVLFLLVSAQAQEAQLLSPGNPIEREISGGQTHLYRITLKAGQFVHFDAQQTSCDVVLTLITPDGKKLEANLTPFGLPESFSSEALTTGDYQLNLQARGPAKLTGSYRLLAEVKAAPSTQDKQRLAAETFLLEAQKLGSFAQAAARAEKAQQALAQWQQLGDRLWEAQTLLLLANTHNNLREQDKAIAEAEQALTLLRTLNNKPGETQALQNLGSLLMIKERREEARASFENALRLCREVGHKLGEFSALQGIGDAYARTQQPAKAREAYEQGLAIAREIAYTFGEMNARVSIASLFVSNAEQQKEFEIIRTHLEAALPIARELRNSNMEIQILDRLGAAHYFGKQDATQAIEYHERALSLARASGIRFQEMLQLQRLGFIHVAVGPNLKARDYYETALPIARELKQAGNEERILANLGNVADNHEKRVGFYEQAYAISQRLGDKQRMSGNLQAICGTYMNMGKAEKAIPYCEQAIAFAQETKTVGAENFAWRNLAEAYAHLSQYEKAMESLQQAMTVAEKNNYPLGVANALVSLATLHFFLGETDKARAFVERALQIPEIKNSGFEMNGRSLLGQIYHRQKNFEKAEEAFLKLQARINELGSMDLAKGRAALGLGWIYNAMGQYEKAQEYLEQALTLIQRAHEPVFFPYLHQSLGDTWRGKKQYDKAIASHQQALLMDQQYPNGLPYSAPYHEELMKDWKAVGNVPLAIFHGKQAVNSHQEQRFSLRNLEKDLQQSFLRSKEETYRTLADLLIAQGRLPEAEQVIRMLKEEEYFEYVRRDGKNAPKSQKAALTPEEAALDKRYREIADQLTTIGTERGALLEKKVRTPEENQRLSKLEADLSIAAQSFQRFLDGLAGEMSKNKDSSKRLDQLSDAQGLQADLRELGKGVVALYTVVGEDKYSVILTTADVQKAYQTPIKAAALNRKILAFREVLQNPKLDPLPLAQELYKILLAPVEKDLRAMKAQTLMWSLDGVLRYVPMTALHDGKQYLVESYRQAVFTPVSNARLKDAPSRNWHALGLGVTKAHGLTIPALPGVAEEMHGIIREAGSKSGVLPGSIKLDEAFTQESMLTGLREQNTVVHIASHFTFQPGNETNSALLLGDGNFLTLANIKTLPNVFSGVELLTLSACNTATGGSGANGKEIEGFGALAQRQGAKAVVASLWPVADRSTKNLMQEFYQLREAKSDVTKAEALREAQIKLLHGEWRVTSETLTARAIVHEEDKTPNLPKFKVDPKAPYAHPYYWAPFILIGNWK